MGVIVSNGGTDGGGPAAKPKRAAESLLQKLKSK